jgi:hypothetical protein
VDAGRAAWEQSSVTRVVSPVRSRKLAKVPFVEMADGRLQGVVSSGSDIERVYVSSVVAGTHGFSCSTNNNRPCGGISSNRPCKHVQALVAEAVLQYGVERVARYLRIEVGEDASTGADLMSLIKGTIEQVPANAVFSRFLRHLAYLELPGSTGPLPEMHWFPAVSR